MIYAGSIGTQIANELLDFNRCGLVTERVLRALCSSVVVHVILCSFELICVCDAFRMNSSPSSGSVSPFSLPPDKSQQPHNQISNSVSLNTKPCRQNVVAEK